MKIKQGLYWSDSHRQFYLVESNNVFRFWRYKQAKPNYIMESGLERSDFKISDFFMCFDPTYIGEF